MSAQPSSTPSENVLFEASPRCWLPPPWWLAGTYLLLGLLTLWATLQGVTLSNQFGSLSWSPPIAVLVGLAVALLEAARAARVSSVRYRLVGATLEVSAGVIARKVRTVRHLGDQFRARVDRDAVILEAPGHAEITLEGLDEADAETLADLLAQLPPSTRLLEVKGSAGAVSRPPRRLPIVLAGLMTLALLAGEARARRERETRALFDSIVIQIEQIAQAELVAFAPSHQALFARRIERTPGLAEDRRAWLLNLAQYCEAYSQSRSQHVGWSLTDDTFALEVGIYTPEATNQPEQLPLRRANGQVRVLLRRSWSIWPTTPTLRIERTPDEATELFAGQLSAALERSGLDHELAN